MKIDAVSHDSCCNCQACVQACPTKAIQMQYPETDAFQFPMIDGEKCIDCGKCARVCPVLNSINDDYEIKGCFYGQHKDDEIRKKSSSGGAFRAIADMVLKNNGVVFAATMDYDRLEVVFDSTREKPIEAFMKSKYVESDISGTYPKIQAELDAGVQVLFCGTSCQVRGLQLFLKKNYANLLTVDFICHGVPSQNFFKEHCDTIEKKYNSKIVRFDFRPKTLGWTPQCLDIRLKNGKKIDVPMINDSFFFGFMSKNLYLRKCCYSCPYADHHPADITIADFWGYAKSGLEITNDEKGMSLILCNTEAGIKAIDGITNSFSLKSCSPQVANYTVKKRIPKPELLEKREKFIQKCSEIGFEKAAAQTYMPSRLKQLLYAVKFKIQLWKL